MAQHPLFVLCQIKCSAVLYLQVGIHCNFLVQALCDLCLSGTISRLMERPKLDTPEALQWDTFHARMLADIRFVPIGNDQNRNNPLQDQLSPS